jgi:nucleoside-diphosphate-sugar epimerase
MSMNLFVTGGTGFIGSHLIKKWLNDDRIGLILCMDRSGKRKSNSEKLRYVKCSLEDVKDLKLDANIDAAVHLAGYWAQEDRNLVFGVNLTGTMNLIDMCKKNAIPGILYTGTINVKLKHRGAYASSKLAAEKLISGSGLGYTIIRPTLVYGKGDKGMSRIVKFVDAGKPVPIFGNGKKIEQPIFIDELTEIISRSLFDGWVNGVIEAGGLDAMTYNGMVDQVAQSGGKKNAKKLHLPRWIFLTGAKMLEAIHIKSPVSSEQIYHMDEDLPADAEATAQRYGVELKPFLENMKNYR